MTVSKMEGRRGGCCRVTLFTISVALFGMDGLSEDVADTVDGVGDLVINGLVRQFNAGFFV